MCDDILFIPMFMGPSERRSEHSASKVTARDVFSITPHYIPPIPAKLITELDLLRPNVLIDSFKEHEQKRANHINKLIDEQ